MKGTSLSPLIYAAFSPALEEDDTSCPAALFSLKPQHNDTCCQRLRCCGAEFTGLLKTAHLVNVVCAHQPLHPLTPHSVPAGGPG